MKQVQIMLNARPDCTVGCLKLFTDKDKLILTLQWQDGGIRGAHLGC